MRSLNLAEPMNPCLTRACGAMCSFCYAMVQEPQERSTIKVKQALDLLDELLQDHNDQGSLKKIESLEKKLINNLDESSYSELIKLKSQLNRD